ncbi:MAG: GNAT family N-acetyltransferase [Patescibacteria group bacterium]
MNNLLERFAKLIVFYDKKDRSKFKRFVSSYFYPRYILNNDEFFDWQYLKNPHNFFKNYSVGIIKENKKFLGFLGLVPYKLKVFDKTHKNCGALCNLMIDNACRALGLGSVLVAACQKNFSLITGTGYNPKTEQMYKRIGNWFAMGNLDRYIFIIDPQKCALIENPQNPDFHKFEKFMEKETECLSQYNFEEIEKFGDDINDFWKKARNRFPVTVERDDDYLNWRFTNHPLLKYSLYAAKKDGEINGYLVSRTETAQENNREYKIGRIVDLVSMSECDDFIISAFVKLMKQKRADFIDFFSTGKFYAEALEKRGFINSDKFGLNRFPRVFKPIERNRGPINFLIYFDDSLEYIKEKLLDINSWYMTLSEGDLDRPNIPRGLAKK